MKSTLRRVAAWASARRSRRKGAARLRYARAEAARSGLPLRSLFDLGPDPVTLRSAGGTEYRYRCVPCLLRQGDSDLAPISREYTFSASAAPGVCLILSSHADEWDYEFPSANVRVDPMSAGKTILSLSEIADEGVRAAVASAIADVAVFARRWHEGP